MVVEGSIWKKQLRADIIRLTERAGIRWKFNVLVSFMLFELLSNW